MKNMIIDISDQSVLCAVSYTRAGQTRYRMGDSLLDEQDIADPKLRKNIREFIELSDKKAIQDIKKLIKDKKKEAESKEDKPTDTTEESVEPESQDSEQNSDDEGTEETEFEDL